VTEDGVQFSGSLKEETIRKRLVHTSLAKNPGPPREEEKG
jgi:hypothetical protein